MIENHENTEPTEQDVLNSINIKLGLDLKTTNDLWFIFDKNDQEIMQSNRKIDYLDENQLVSKIKNSLQDYENFKKPEEMDKNLREIIWMYYHHASQFLFLSGDKEEAIKMIDKAQIYLQHENKITGLLSFLYQGKYKEAEDYINKYVTLEKETADYLLQEFKRNYE